MPPGKDSLPTWLLLIEHEKEADTLGFPERECRPNRDAPGPGRFDHLPDLVPQCNSPRSQMLIEKARDHPVGILRLRHIRIVKEAMKQPFPYMQVGIHSQPDQRGMGV